MLGLERVLEMDPPTLLDGAELNDHQVDALSGTLAALVTEIEEGPQTPNGNGNGGLERHRARRGRRCEHPRTATAEDEEDLDDELEPDEEPQDWADEPSDDDEEVVAEAPEDPGESRRFWFEHATGAGKTVAAVGFVEASRTGGILILTHRRNLVDQFIGEISDRGYKDRLSPPLLGQGRPPLRPGDRRDLSVVRPQLEGSISDAYAIVICDEAHTALGEKTSACIRQMDGPGLHRHDRDRRADRPPRRRPLPHPDLALRPRPGRAPRRDRAASLHPHPAGPRRSLARQGAASPRRGRPGLRPGGAREAPRPGPVQRRDRRPLPVALLARCPGVLYTAGVKHANNVAAAMRDVGINAQAVSGETPKRELAEILAAFERGDVDVLCNAMLLAEGWNSPRATICMHLAPTASRRIYQQRVGRVTRRAPGKEAGLVIDLVHPATTSDETIVTLHSLLDRDVYRGGAIVVGPVRRGRGRRVRVERRIVPVSADPERRVAVLERELWRIAVENLNYSEQHAWAALAGSKVTSNQWRRAKAMIQHDEAKELRRRFLLTCVQRNRNHQLRLKAMAEVAALRDAEAFDDCVDIVTTWSREDRRAGAKLLLQALAERRIGRRDQAQAWVWRLAETTRDLHEQYAVQRWPETKRLLGLFVNSSGRAHGRNARRLVTAARQQDRRLSVALLAAAVAHTPEAEEVLRGARMRMARKPSAVARELLRNFPKPGSSRRRRRKKGGGGGQAEGERQRQRQARSARCSTRGAAMRAPMRSRTVRMWTIPTDLESTRRECDDVSGGRFRRRRLTREDVIDRSCRSRRAESLEDPRRYEAQRDLARAQAQALARVGDHDQVPALVDAICDALPLGA